MGMKLYNGMSICSTTVLYLAPKQPDDRFLHANRTYVIRAGDAVAAGASVVAQRHHPRGVRYRAPGSHRALAHLISNPAHTATGFAALALYGLPYLTDCADTVLTGPTVSRKTFGTEFEPGFIRSDPGEVWHLAYRDITVQAAPPPDALAQALRLVRQGEVAWPVVDIPGLTPETTRAIQLVDAARHFLRIHPVELLRASRNRINLAWLVDVLTASSAAAESPKETEMRLLTQLVTSRFNLRLQEQFLLHDATGSPITRFDLALPDLKIGLMYDGAHHWEHERRHKDTRINIESAVCGWLVLRFSAETLWILVEKLTEILAARV